jgi:hypothetical protein
MYLLVAIEKKKIKLINVFQEAIPLDLISLLDNYIFNEWITIEETRPKMDVRYNTKTFIISLKDIISRMQNKDLKKSIFSIAFLQNSATLAER